MLNLRLVDLEALAEADGVILRGRPGGERHGPCPKCGGTDRFRVKRYDSRDWYACRQCHDAPGDAIDYLRWLHGLTYPQALARLGIDGNARPTTTRPARRAQPVDALGKPIPDRLDDPPPADWQTAARNFADDCAARLWSPAGARALAYLREKRLLTDATLTAYCIGYNDADRWLTWGALRVFAARGVTIPTEYGRDLWRVNIRRPVGAPKYQAVTGSRVQLFNGDALASRSVSVAVCAGEFDTMLAQQAAPVGAVAVTFGSESKTPTWEARYLLRGRRVVIVYDADEAGEAGARRWCEYVPWAGIAKPAAHDLTDMARAGANVGAWLLAQFTPALPADLEAVASIPDELARLEAWGAARGYEVTYTTEAGDRLRMTRRTE